MLIALYRKTRSGRFAYRLIFDREGQVFSQLLRLGDGEEGDLETALGPVDERETDGRLLRLTEAAIAEGYEALYCYVPKGRFPQTSRHLRDNRGIAVEPDPRDGIPVWRSDDSKRGGQLSYLLFTIFSAEAM